VVEPAADYPREDLPLGRPSGGPAADDEEPHPDDYEPGMADQELRAALEAILLVVDEPVTELLLAQVMEEPPIRVEATLHALAEEYVRTGRGFELRQAAGGWRLYTRAEYATYVERFVLDGQQARLTQAALETLAVVAYKQPVTRSRISAIRGVNCDGVIKTLLNRGLVEECGTEAESGAHLYRTTRLFLEKLGINGVDELPPLAPFLPDNVDEIDIAHR
jgi:segregation and condensation protein B